LSNCIVCGTVEYWHVAGPGDVATSCCPNCNPPATVILLDEGNDWGIDESEIHGMPSPVDPCQCFCHNPEHPKYVDEKHAATCSCVTEEGPAFDIDWPNSGMYMPNAYDIVFGTPPTSLSIDGSEVLTAYDELPENAEQGKIAFKKGEDAAYIFDGEKWQNLGEALLGKKHSALTPKDKKIDRRAAIAATRAKNEESE
jgi:hypothetical protein